MKELTEEELKKKWWQYLTPNAKLAIKKLKIVAEKHELLWETGKDILKYNGRYNLDLKIENIEQYKILQEALPKLRKYYKVHNQIRVTGYQEQSTWEDMTPDPIDLGYLKHTKSFTISFSRTKKLKTQEQQST